MGSRKWSTEAGVVVHNLDTGTSHDASFMHTLNSEHATDESPPGPSPPLDVRATTTPGDATPSSPPPAAAGSTGGERGEEGERVKEGDGLDSGGERDNNGDPRSNGACSPASTASSRHQEQEGKALGAVAAMHNLEGRLDQVASGASQERTSMSLFTPGATTVLDAPTTPDGSSKLTCTTRMLTPDGGVHGASQRGDRASSAPVPLASSTPDTAAFGVSALIEQHPYKNPLKQLRRRSPAGGASPVRSLSPSHTASSPLASPVSGGGGEEKHHDLNWQEKKNAKKLAKRMRRIASGTSPGSSPVTSPTSSSSSSSSSLSSSASSSRAGSWAGSPRPADQNGGDYNDKPLPPSSSSENSSRPRSKASSNNNDSSTFVDRDVDAEIMMERQRSAVALADALTAERSRQAKIVEKGTAVMRQHCLDRVDEVGTRTC